MPDGLDLFSWSMPFLAEKIMSMMFHILKQCSPEELKDALEEDPNQVLKSEADNNAEKTKKKIILKSKI